MYQDRSGHEDDTEQPGSTLTSVLIIFVMALVVVVRLVLLAIRSG